MSKISNDSHNDLIKKLLQKEKDIRIKELEEFLEEVIEHPYMCGSPIWEEGWELLNKNKDDNDRTRNA